MRILHKTAYCCFIIFFLAGCRGREVVIPLAFEGEKLVLWGKLEAGKPARIQVMKTFPAVGPIPEQMAVNTATVSLYKNGELFSLLTSVDENGLYGSESLIEAGQNYVVKVEAPGLTPAESAEVTVPASVPEFRYIRKRDAELQRNSNSGPQDHVTLYFQANEQLRTSYMVLGFNVSFTDESRGASYYSSTDNTIANEEDCHSWASSSDRRFGYLFMMNGRCISFDAPLNFFVSTAKYVPLPDFKGEYIRARTVTMLVASVSKEWFVYNQIEEKQPEGLDHMVLPPQPAYTNVKNGYGIIYGYNAIQTDLM